MDTFENVVDLIQDAKVRRCARDLADACKAADEQCFLVLFQHSQHSPLVLTAGLPDDVAAAWAESFKPQAVR